MPRTSYQYGTSPRKYEPEYTNKRTKKSEVSSKKVSTTREEIKRNLEKQRAKKAEERMKKIKQVILVVTIFGMLLTVSYREISIMEMFNHKKDLESQLAVIEKENGQVEKNIKEVESTLDWNKIKQVATEQLGMQSKAGKPLDLEKTDFVETENKYIKEDKTSAAEKIVEFIIDHTK